jgi:hypothetical protein
MEITLAVLADCANTSADGKLNIMGIFQVIHAAQAPVQHPQMSVVIVASISPAERGQTYDIVLKLLGADGQTLATFPGVKLTAPDQAAVLNPEAPVIMNISGLVLPNYGEYAFHVLVDSQDKKRIPFAVRLGGPQLSLPSID